MSISSNPVEMTASQQLKSRFIKTRREIVEKFKINKTDFCAFVVKKNEGFNSATGHSKIFKVWDGRLADLFLTETLIEYKSHLENQ